MTGAARDVHVLGVGLHPFGRFPEVSTREMSRVAAKEALDDAGVPFGAVEAAYYAHVYPDGTTPGQAVLGEFGLTGIPIINMENACASGSSAVWQAFHMIRSGVHDVVLVVGSDEVPRGPVSVSPQDSPERLLGTDHMMAGYALDMRRYIETYDAPVEAIAEVAVKAHDNAALNPRAQLQKRVTLEEVLASRVIADPLTLFQCCPTSEGAAAAVLVSDEALQRYDRRRAVKILGASLRTTRHELALEDGRERGRDGTELAARDVYEMAGLGPEDVDVVQVHDAATIGEVEHLELCGLLERGEGWVATLEGRTRLGGALPVNTDGGLQAMGHPFGASGIRMLHELTLQIRGEASPRQIEGASIGLAQCTGSGGVNTVIMLGGGRLSTPGGGGS